mgnify:CR=1 FL=1
MSLSFQGRAILPGAAEGRVLVSRRGLNTYAAFFTSIHEPGTQALCMDRENPDLFGLDLKDRIICLPQTTGSTSSGAVWQRLALLHCAPKAVLFSETIDPLAAGGLIVAEVWAGRRIITIDELGPEFLPAVSSGDLVGITEQGLVIVEKHDLERGVPLATTGETPH